MHEFRASEELLLTISVAVFFASLLPTALIVTCAELLGSVLERLAKRSHVIHAAFQARETRRRSCSKANVFNCGSTKDLMASLLREDWAS